MSEHKPDVQRQPQLGSFRGGCELCAWMGPYRDDIRDAVTDAQQHALHVRLYPEPNSHA